VIAVSVVVLKRELFTVPEAARQLVVPESTLRWWLEGGERRGVNYLPVLRTEPTGSSLVTWGEFVEARYLREYRVKRVPLQRLRRAIDFLRESFEVPYPLAHFKPFVGPGREILLEAQRVADLPPEFWLVLGAEDPAGQQILLTPASEFFLDHVGFSHDDEQWADRLYPAGKDSPVVMDPVLSSGSPTVQGIRTENLVELVEAGEDIEDVAHDFGLELPELHAALAFEWDRRLAKPPAEILPAA
jgi:uncharacterized protein (DUF433 family)